MNVQARGRCSLEGGNTRPEGRKGHSSSALILIKPSGLKSKLE